MTLLSSLAWTECDYIRVSKLHQKTRLIIHSTVIVALTDSEVVIWSAGCLLRTRGSQSHCKPPHWSISWQPASTAWNSPLPLSPFMANGMRVRIFEGGIFIYEPPRLGKSSSSQIKFRWPLLLYRISIAEDLHGANPLACLTQQLVCLLCLLLESPFSPMRISSRQGVFFSTSSRILSILNSKQPTTSR